MEVTFTRMWPNRRKVSAKALQAFKAKVRAVTGQMRGRTMNQIVAELRPQVPGWRAYSGLRSALAATRPRQMDLSSAEELPRENQLNQKL
jgi:hypothetical protein